MAADASAPTLSTRFPRPSLITIFGLIFVALLVFWLASTSSRRRRLLRGLPDRDHDGCVYALVALGYTLVYGILELINFAHGDVFMLGGMFTITYARTASACSTGQGAVTIPIVLARCSSR